MNGCAAIQESLSAFLDGELAAEERAGIEAHLRGCGVCRGELEALRAAAGAVAALPRCEAPASILEAVRAQQRSGRPAETGAGAGGGRVIVAAEDFQARPRARFSLRSWSSVAALLVAAVLVYLALAPTLTRHDSMEVAPHAVSERRTPMSPPAENAPALSLAPEAAPAAEPIKEAAVTARELEAAAPAAQAHKMKRMGQPAQRLGVESPARSSPAEAVAKDEFQPPGEGMAVKAKEPLSQEAPLPKPAETPAPKARPVPHVSKADAEPERRQDSQGAQKDLLDRDQGPAPEQARDDGLKAVPPAKDAVPRREADPQVATLRPFKPAAQPDGRVGGGADMEGGGEAPTAPAALETKTVAALEGAERKRTDTDKIPSARGTLEAVGGKDSGRAQENSISKMPDPALSGPAQVYRVPAALLVKVQQGLKELMEAKGGQVEELTLATGAKLKEEMVSSKVQVGKKDEREGEVSKTKASATPAEEKLGEQLETGKSKPDPVGKPVHIVIKFPPERRAEVLLALAEFQRQLPAWLKESDTRMAQQTVKEGIEEGKESAKLSKDDLKWDSLVIQIEPLSK